TKAIKQGKVKRGDRILSINELSNEFFLSRDTVQKAYEILQKDKIIHSVRGKGFYINRTDITLCYRVLLLFNKLSSYKKMIYDGFVQTMDSKGLVDLKIHHSSAKLLDTIVSANLGEYDYYVVMPHFYEHHEQVADTLSKIPADKLMLLDKAMTQHFEQVPAVYQDFENDIILALEAGLDQLSKYDTLVYADTPSTLKPAEIARGFRRFCQQNHFAYQVIGDISSTYDVRPGQVYIVIDDMDLLHLIKSIQQKGYTAGKEVGIICYNETPLKEILLNGISTISTDHYQMGKTAAEMILEQRTGRIKNKFTLISRASL
ncbi:MAG: GntR family transcriptional regulator, partial [Chitinophagaceae bacterium]